MNPITVIFKIISVLAALYVTIAVFSRNRKKIANIIFGLAFIFLGLYSVIMLVYEIPFSDDINTILINSSLYILSIGTLLFVMAIQTLIQGEDYPKSKINYFNCALALGLFIIFIIKPYQVSIASDPYSEDKPYLTLISTGIFTLYLMIYNVILIHSAIQKIDPAELEIRKKFWNVFRAQLIALLVPLMSIVGSISGNIILYSLMYIFLAISLLFIGYALKR